MKIFSFNLSDSGMGVSVFSRWWTSSGRTVVFVFILAILLPYVCSDDSHVLHGTNQEGSKFQYAQINISFMDPEKKKETSSTFEGRYGMNSVVTSVSGTVMHTISASDKGKPPRTNHFGCTKYTNKRFPSESWIALVERGECVFTNKIRIATKDHNASAIVIYNNSSEVDTIMDHIALSSISVLIARKDGLMIAELLEKGHPVHMHIWPGREGYAQSGMQNSISKTSVLFVSISFIVLMIISLAWLVFYYIQRFRYSHAKERLARRLACAAKKAIAKIPQKTVKVGDKELDSDFDQCAVCIEPYKAHDVIRILPCRHVFHKSCVDPWLLDQRSCPMCKLDILRAYGMQIGGSQESVHPDPELGPVAAAAQEEPEVSSSLEDTQTEEVKVLLVPHTCLHFHVGREKGEEEFEGEASTSLLGAVGGEVPPSASMSSIQSRSSSSSSNSRAEKSDKAEGGLSETQALIGRRKDGKRRWRSKEEVEEEDETGAEEDDFDGGSCGEASASASFDDITDSVRHAGKGSTKVKEPQKKWKDEDSSPLKRDSSSSSLSSGPVMAKQGKGAREKINAEKNDGDSDKDKDSLSVTAISGSADDDDVYLGAAAEVEFHGDKTDQTESVA